MARPSKGNATTVSATFKDKRTGAHQTMTGPGTNSYGGPEMGDYLSGNKSGPFPVVNFGKITFSNSKLNGQPFGSFMVTRFNMVDSKNKTLIKTTKFASDNETFKTIFEHAT